MRRNHRLHRSASSQFQSILGQQLPVPLPDIPIDSDAASLRREKLEFHAQLFEAAQVQRKLSGPRSLRRRDLQIATEVFAARYLSGDFVSLSEHEGRVFAAIGDIAGKGLAAGMWFTNLVGLLQRYSSDNRGPSAVAAEINRHLCCLRPGAPFVTMFLAQVDCERSELTYCTAGHFPPVLLRASGSTELLDTGGPLLGALVDAEFQSGWKTLEPGDSLLAYSDGVLECNNCTDEEFGLERLLAEARRASRHSAHATLLTLLAAVQDFANGQPLCDDVSLMVIQRDPNFASGAA
ncbi:MAG TPA: PP2C family protein-serine/threonine phosphatase [Clostridia bacterium]|nr:PP2C family protein-serine/threonine phosphatase [Clostridia bacterium]